ncbi:MAG: CpaD family pilus assembly protein [Sphingopyxis sp.]|jgi:pilus assembly protein CpaD|nr:CpaD family pilus assembly protein [Sphingopyxis sp.]
MHKRIILTALLAGVTLTGCLGGSGSTANRSLESVHQPIVRTASYVLDADASAGMLTPTEQRRVSEWLDAMEVGYGDRVSIDESAAMNGRAARDAVAMLLARKGLLLDDTAPITSGSIAPGSIRVIISRATAHVPGCPDWGTRSFTNTNNHTTSNYGCATNANLAAMVADANDLIAGQGNAVSDPLTASRAVGTFRSTPPTGTQGLSRTGSGGSSGGGR